MAHPSPAQQDFTRAFELYKRKRWNEAEQAARRLLRKHGDRADGWALLAASLHHQNRLTEAADAFNRSLAMDARNPAVCDQYAEVLYTLGRLQEAEKVLRHSLALAPDRAQPLTTLATVLRKRGHAREAEQSLRRALVANPRFAPAMRALARMVRRRGDFEDARRLLSDVVGVMPESTVARNELGSLFHEWGRHQEAKEYFEEAARLAPDDATSQRNLGAVLAEMGDRDGAVDAFRQAITNDPDDAVAWSFLATTKTFAANDPELRELETRLERCADDAVSASRLHLALARAYRQINAEPDQVFRHVAEGGRRRREHLPYDATRTATRFREVAQVCSADWLQRHALPSPNTARDKPILIIGMPRSGTSLLEQILAAHPGVAAGGERRDLAYAITRQAGPGSPDIVKALGGLDAADIAPIAEDYRAAVLASSPGFPLVTDKNPENFMLTGLIAAALPDSPILHMIREPADTCLSCFMQDFGTNLPYSYDLADLGHYYRQYADLMDHWREVLPSGRMLEVHYENLVQDPEQQVRSILEHLGLDWHPGCLSFHTQAGTIATASFDQARQPIHQSSIGSWRPYREYLAPLFSALGRFAPADTTARSDKG